MDYNGPMTIVEGLNGYAIGLIDDTQFAPNSSDNIISYTRSYFDKSDQDYICSSKYGIILFKNGEIENSVCIGASGGKTGIHPTCSIFEENHFLICCSDKIFCLTIPELDLFWIANADHATCFEIFKIEDGYIVHGELEISRLDKTGAIVWQYSGPDIWTTPSGKDDFVISGNEIEAINWDGGKFKIDAQTGNPIE